MASRNNKSGPERLPSFKGPRDLSLSARGDGGDKKGLAAAAPASAGAARPRRVFTPNIPPKRDRGAGPSNPAPVSSSSSNKDHPKPSTSNERGRGRPRPNTNRGGQRGGARQFKPRGELIQSESVFAEGMGDPMAMKRSSVASYRSGYGGSRYKSGEGGPARMSSMNRNTLKTIIKDEDDAESNKKLFGNENFEQNQDENDISDPNIPVTVPLVSYVPDAYMEPISLAPDVIKDNLPIPPPDEPNVSVRSGIESLPQLSLITIKQEKMDNSELQAAVSSSTKSTSQADHEELSSSKHDVSALLAAMSLEPVSLAGTYRVAPPEGILAVFQLPDELPVLNESIKDAEAEDNEKNSSGLVQNLDDLPDGLIGRFEIMSSGRTRFILGENVFDVEPGKLVGFRQECHAIDPENNILTNLGPINRKFVITPDVTYLIND